MIGRALFAFIATALVACGSDPPSGAGSSSASPPPRPEGRRVFTHGTPQTDTLWALSAKGERLVAGGFSGSAEATMEPRFDAKTDGLVVEVDPQGRSKWTTLLSGDALTMVLSVAATDKGAVAVGRYNGTLAQDGSKKSDGLDSFVVLLDGSGAPVQHRTFGGPKSDSANDVAVDPDGSLWVGGHFATELEGASGPVTTADGAAFVNHYDAKLEKVGSFVIDTERSQAVSNIDVTADQVVVTVNTFDRGVASLFRIIRFDKNGAQSVSVDCVGAGQKVAEALIAQPDGSIIVGGYFNASIDCGGIQRATGGANDMFVASLDPNGTVKWLTTIGGGDNDVLYDAAVLPDGEVLFTGVVSKGYTFGSFFSEGPASVIGRLDASGSVIDVKPIIIAGRSVPYDIELVGTDFAVAGTFDLDLTPTASNATAGAFDAMVVLEPSAIGFR